ncbi:hypothetical protein [Streptomyces sp. NPDC000851]
MLTQLRADELIPGDVFDTRCGDFAKITKVRLLENDNHAAQDRVEITWEDHCISPSRVLLADYLVTVKV